MNYINSFSIAGSTYICTPLKTDSSDNWGTYNANMYPSIASYNTNYTSIASNYVLDGNILYSAHIIPAGSDTKHSVVGDVYIYYDVYTYEPDHVDFSVQSNFILNGSVSIWAHPTSSILLSQEVVQGYVSKHISYSNSIIFNNNIIVNCATTNISIPSLFNDSRSEAYTIANNVLINTDFNLLSSYANKKTIIGGGLGKLATGVPPTVTALSSYPYLSTPAVFIGGGELTANTDTDTNNIFIGGNNFYYSVEVAANDAFATVVEDIGFVIPNETGSTEYPPSDVSVVYVSSYIDESHYSLDVKSGYYYSSIQSNTNPAYRKLYCDSFDGYYDTNGNPCSALSDKYYCIKPTLYDISIQVLNVDYSCYYTWQGGIGYGTWSGSTWSVIAPPSIEDSIPVTFRSIDYARLTYINIGSEYDAWGIPANTDEVVPGHTPNQPTIGFAVRNRPWSYLNHQDMYSSSSFIDSQGNSVWHWVFTRSTTSIGWLDTASFHYTELPKLVIIAPSSNYTYRLHIHKITTNSYEI